MSAEGFVVSNPKTNNKNLLLTYETKTGERKKLKTLRPGEAFTCDHKNLTVTEVARPLRLHYRDGAWIPDPVKGSANAAKRV